MLSSLTVLLYVVSTALALLVFLGIRNVGKRERGLPPGPPTVPLLGNLNIFPKEFVHYKMTEWAKTYGEIYSLKIASGTVIVLNSIEAAKELMDRGSIATSDRPVNFMVDLITGGKNMGLARYSQDWRALRRAALTVLSPQACENHLNIQAAESAQLLYDILLEPEHFYTHIRRNTFSVITSVIFGRRAPRFQTREVTDFYEVQHLWEHVIEPGAHPPLDILPILRRVPERWAPWKKLCREVRRLQRKLYFGLLEECEERIKAGRSMGTFLEDVIERREELNLSRELTGYLGGVLLEAGSDTTASYLQTLVLALVTYPDVQRRAQEEIDSVVGQKRVPTPEDLPMLPYIQGIIKEVHRWRPVAPVGVPHAALSDTVYKGYLIPKDCTIFVNNWGIFHDERLFDNPEVFDPERYIKNEYGVREGVDTKDFRENLAFGYGKHALRCVTILMSCLGRRICPGRHLAKNTVKINVPRLIWAFNYKPAVHSTTGIPERIDCWNYEKGLLTCPKPFKVEITPRGKLIEDVIKQDFANGCSVLEKFEELLSPEDRDFVREVRSHI